MEGAAARAAARAASLGLAAASTGYASLGGVDDHVRAITYLHRGSLLVAQPDSCGMHSACAYHYL